MLILEDAPAYFQASFSFKAALLESLAQELDDATLDTGPINSEVPNERETQAAAGPIMYYATPLLSGTPPPPCPATPTKPRAAEAKLKKDAGTEFARGVGAKFENGMGFEFENESSAAFEGKGESGVDCDFERGADDEPSLEMDPGLDTYADVDLRRGAGSGFSSDTAAELEYSVFGGESPLSSPPPSRPSSPTKNARQRRDKERSRARRTNKRRGDRAQDIDATRIPKARAKEKHIDSAEKMSNKYNFENIPSASTAYVATREKAGGVSTVQQLLEKGFELVKWDGRSSRPIVDSNGLVIAVLVGQPSDPNWTSAHEDAFALLQENAPQCDFTHRCLHHQRGNFAALNYGISFGGGPQAPGNLCHNKARAGVLERLTHSQCFLRLAGFASSAFSTWMPRLHHHYKTCLDALTTRHSHLTPNFKNSVWAAAAFNFGPRTVTGKHRDAANLPFGICSITALGKFDYTRGGHIVLWELNLIIEFPPGSTILIPSGAISHSNTPIAADELRASFTQYSAGGLFRWVDQGFQKTAKYMKSLSEAEMDRLPELNKARCALGMSLFSTLDELRASKK